MNVVNVVNTESVVNVVNMRSWDGASRINRTKRRLAISCLKIASLRGDLA
jgi:hypothetical protein